MSMPKISDINPEIKINRQDAVNIITTSIAMEELALAHILNAEGEKLQYVLGTLEGRPPGETTLDEILAVNNSVHKTIRDVIKEEILLGIKLEDALELDAGGDGRLITIRGQKIWRDADNVADIRPPSAEITLLRDGDVYMTATVDSMGDGKFRFANLPVWRDPENKYTYQIDEIDTPAGYIKTISGFDVINTIEPGSIGIAGQKIWANDTFTDRPAQVTIILLQNGFLFDSVTIDSPVDGDVSQFLFEDLPRFDNAGEEFVYTVDEENVTGYDKQIDGFEITNTLL